MSWSTQLWVAIELDLAMHALGQLVMVISLCRHSSQFQFPINYIFIDLQTKQCCEYTSMKEHLFGCLEVLLFGQVFIPISLVLYSFFQRKHIGFLCKYLSFKHYPWGFELTANLYKSCSYPASTSSWLCMERKTIHKCTV